MSRSMRRTSSYLPLSGMLPSKTPMDSPFAAADPPGDPGGAGGRAAALSRDGRQPAGLCLHQDSGPAAFVVPYANADEANHAPNENLEIDCFFNGIRTGAALLSHLAEVNAA